jgi:hypothetical protein
MAMKCLRALFATTTLLIGIGAVNATVRIVDDPGGRIGTYVDRYEGVRVSGERVIIDGYCASACTIVLGAIPYDRICVTSRARLGFHAAWNPGPNGRRITNPEATQSLYSMYPFEVRHWIDQRGGLTPHLIFLGRHELAAMYRPCFIDPHVSSHGASSSVDPISAMSDFDSFSQLPRAVFESINDVATPHFWAVDGSAPCATWIAACDATAWIVVGAP